jgi:hypothetical protein
MNQSRELNSTRKNKLQTISEAFRKLFDRVAVRMHSANTNTKNNQLIKNEQLFKKRKYSVSLSRTRKNSYFSQATPDASRKSQGLKEPKPAQTSSTFKEWSCKTIRCSSDPSISNSNELYSKIIEYNQLLITKSFVLEDFNSQVSTKNVRDKRYFRKTPLNSRTNQDVNQDMNYESKIRNCQRKRRFNNISKNQQQFKQQLKEPKGMLFIQGSELEPW